MIRRAARTFMLLLIALVAMQGMLSAWQSVPDLAAMERDASLRAVGASLADICGSSEDGEERCCVFCHQVPDVPQLVGPVAEQRVSHTIRLRIGRDLIRGNRYLQDHVSTRGPPRAA